MKLLTNMDRTEFCVYDERVKHRYGCPVLCSGSREKCQAFIDNVKNSNVELLRRLK
jgi:hypothetical protein